MQMLPNPKNSKRLLKKKLKKNRRRKRHDAGLPLL
jgi:hypothetical protein